MRPRHDPGRPIFLGEVVEQPDRVSDLVLARLHSLAPVNMQSLMAFRWQRGTPVEREDLEILPVEDVGDSSQLPWIVPAEVENGVLVNEVREPVRAFFLMSLEACFVTLGVDEVVETLDDLRDRGRPKTSGIGRYPCSSSVRTSGSVRRSGLTPSSTSDAANCSRDTWSSRSLPATAVPLTCLVTGQARRRDTQF